MYFFEGAILKKYFSRKHFFKRAILQIDIFQESYL